MPLVSFNLCKTQLKAAHGYFFRFVVLQCAYIGTQFVRCIEKNAHLLKLVGSLIPNAHKNHVKALTQTTDP